MWLPGLAYFTVLGLCFLFVEVPLIQRTALAVLTIFPTAFLMGMPFPLGMRVLGQREPDLTPWAGP